MARGFGRTALRAALGGIAGGLEGLGAMREAQRVEQEQARALERQRAMDELAMLNQGFMRAEDAAGERQQTGAALGRALSSATAMMRPGGLAAGAMPSLQTGDLRRVAEAPGMEAPQQRVTLGGTTFQRESPTSAALRRAEQEFGRERMAKEQQAAEAAKAQEAEVEAMVAAGVPRAQATIAVRRGAKYGDLFMTPAEQARQKADLARLGIERERLGIERTRAATAGAGGGTATNSPFPQDFSREIAKIQDFLPTTDAQGKLIAPKRVLSGVKSLAVQQGGPSGSLVGQVTNLGATMSGADTSNEQLYNTIADGIATAYAIQEQRGRNVSDKDVANRISQIKLMPNEVGNLEVQALKGQRLMQWANALMRGSVPQVNPGATMAPPRLESTGQQRAMTPKEWMVANPPFPGESRQAYIARGKAATGEQ